VLDNPALTLVVLFLTIALNVVLIVKIPKGFFPQEDTGALSGAVRGPQDASFPVMNASVQQIVGVIKSDPAVANVIAFTGGSGATNTGSLYVALKPLAERKANAAQIIDRLRCGPAPDGRLASAINNLLTSRPSRQKRAGCVITLEGEGEILTSWIEAEFPLDGCFG
jgi:multidrug efflux pump